MKIKTSAITLVELIIATLLVSMVVAGVLSADYGLRRMSENSAGDVKKNIEAQAIAALFRAEVKSLHASPVDPGITMVKDELNHTSVCFRHDVVVGGDFTPDNYEDDKHTCFTYGGDGLYRCEKDTPAPCVVQDRVHVGVPVKDQLDNPLIAPQVLPIDTGLYAFRMTVVARGHTIADIEDGKLTAGTDSLPQAFVDIFETVGF